tara:strand:+ start:1971 stop:2606 length:636 start_codon:yes stop_codon:yes gene_type:complete
MENTTSISELPSNPVNNTIQQIDNQQNNYKPINIHPNPYGISDQNPILPNPEQTANTQKMPQQNVYLEQNQLQEMGQQRLPSRDIPQDTTTYAQDQEITPDYIPVQENMKDYVRDYQDMNMKNVAVHEAEKTRAQKLDDFFAEIQTPVLVCLLYFIFQTPYLNKVLFKKMSFLQIYNSDGNFNLYGLIFKSLLFGTSYYGLYTITNMLSEL